MKKELNSSVTFKICNSAYLKLLIALSWLSIIGAAGYHGVFLEAALSTMLITVGAYLVYTIYNPQPSKREANDTTRLGYTPSKDNYLEVFMPANNNE